MNKELKKLSRKELLEILLEQTKRIEELEVKLEESEKKLESKKVSLSETGTLAEAALKLSDIFKRISICGFLVFAYNMSIYLLKNTISDQGKYCLQQVSLYMLRMY